MLRNHSAPIFSELQKIKCTTILEKQQGIGKELPTCYPLPTLHIYIEELLMEKENSALLQNAIDSLSPQRRQVFMLCKVNGKSYKEVSELLGISVSTISNHIVKSTKIIRAYLDKNREVLITLLLASPFVASS